MRSRRFAKVASVYSHSLSSSSEESTAHEGLVTESKTSTLERDMRCGVEEEE
jgi:hypothetical protein